MKKLSILALGLILITKSFAGLPPTTTQGSNDVSSVPTFFFKFPGNQITHTGVTAYISPSAATSGVTSLGANGFPQLTGAITLSAGSNVTLTQNGQFITISSTASSTSTASSGGLAIFSQSGGTSIMTDMGNPYVYTSATAVSQAYVGMYNGGSSGNTIFKVNRWANGVVASSVTGTAASNAGLGVQSLVNLSGTLNYNSLDMATVDILSVANGSPQDLTVGLPAPGDGGNGGGTAYTAGNALSLVGTQFNVLPDNVSIGINSSNQLTSLSYLTLTNSAPLDVGSSDIVGISSYAARADHVHKGLHSQSVLGSPQMFGDSIWNSGQNILITQSGQNFYITATSSGNSSLSLTASNPLSVGSANNVGVSTYAMRADAQMQGVHSLSVTGSPQIYSDINIIPGNNISIIQYGQNIIVTGSPTIYTGGQGITISNNVINAYPDGSSITFNASRQLQANLGGVSVGGVVSFNQSGGTSVITDIAPHRFAQAMTINSIGYSAYSCGTSGSTNIQINQYRNGNLIITGTGSIPSGNGKPCGGSIVLSNTFNILTNDVITEDITSVAGGLPQDLTLELDSGALAGPVGPGVTPLIYGSVNSPNLIAANGTITFTNSTYSSVTSYISGSASSVTAATIQSCLLEGQVLKLIPESSTNTVTVTPSATIIMNGQWIGGNQNPIAYQCDSNLKWIEMSRQ